jgi:hypothetical protein
MTISDILSSIDAEISRLQQARDLLVSNAVSRGTTPVRAKRRLSTAARKRMAEAQRKRWAASKKAAK